MDQIIPYFNLVCAAYVLLKENNITINRRMYRITISAGLKKLYVTVVIKNQSLVYTTNINTTTLNRMDFYTHKKCIVTAKGNIAVLNKTQKLILQTIERM